ncbi:cytochrome P450 [Spongiactinospora sp. TRM90649]|uniref:cytochrome P450 n=1 Tax=Spongiactinospora sp. TRM90649 TaxID=3031114 RepID=UPI0023F82C37|nr:cytochrome P450 [Spongiactinospora sp. TRM90649]MDF5759241.1 cytochrome P450 [Spongiactinospora sp. TRM90649]
MDERELSFGRYADVVAVLSDARFVVPGVGAGGARGSLAWLRAMVCRFSEGAVHERRRAVVAGELAGMDPEVLGRRARKHALRMLATADPRDVTGMVATVARAAPMTALGEAMGVRDLGAFVEAVPVVASVYLTGGSGPEVDAAVEVLVEALEDDGRDDEHVANRIAIVAQACESTAALVADSVALAVRMDDPWKWPVVAIVRETSRFDPPVPVMRRVGARDGVPLTLDLRAANRDPEVFADPDRFDPGRTEGSHLTFGAGRRPCPGADHAVRLAAGVVEAILRRTKETEG